MRGLCRSIISAALLLGLGAVGSAAMAQSVTFGAGQQGSQNYAANGALASVLSREAGFSVNVSAFGGAGVFLPLIANGELDFAAVSAADVSYAYLGRGPFEGRALKQLRVVARLVPIRVGIFVRAEGDIDSIADLKDRAVTYGMTAQPAMLSLIDGILANGGLSPDDVRQVMVPSVGAGVAEFMSGRVDGAFFALRGGKAIEADAAVGGIKWLPLDDTAAAVERMQEAAPISYLLPESPGRGRVGLAETIDVMAQDYLFVAGAHVPDDTVYKAVKALAAAAEDVRKETRIFAEFDPAAMHKVTGLPLHPGAERYYEEAGKH